MNSYEKQMGERLHSWILDTYGSIVYFLNESGLNQKEIIDTINGVGGLSASTFNKLKQLGCNTAWLRSGFVNAIDPIAIPLLSNVYSGDLVHIYSSGMVIGTTFAFPIDSEFHYGIRLSEDNTEIGAKEGDVVVINMTETPVEKDAVVIKTKSGQKIIGHLKAKMDKSILVASEKKLDVIINIQELVVFNQIVQVLHKI